jgi:hypothetical protein
VTTAAIELSSFILVFLFCPLLGRPLLGGGVALDKPRLGGDNRGLSHCSRSERRNTMNKALSCCFGLTIALAIAAPAGAQRVAFGPGATPRVRVAPPAAGRVVRYDRRPTHGRGFGRGQGGFGFGYGWSAYGGGLVEDPERHRDDGYFAGTGDSATVNGAAVYDYDRAYPYDWYRGDDEWARDERPRRRAAPPTVRCEIAPVSGSAVRICRGRR